MKDNSGEYIRRHLMLKYRKLKWLRQLIPRAEEIYDDENDSVEIINSVQSTKWNSWNKVQNYVGGFMNGWRNIGLTNNFGNFNVKSEENLERMLHLIKRANTPQEIRYLLNQIRSIGDDSLYNTIISSLKRNIKDSDEISKELIADGIYDPKLLTNPQEELIRSRYREWHKVPIYNQQTGDNDIPLTKKYTKKRRKDNRSADTMEYHKLFNQQGESTDTNYIPEMSIASKVENEKQVQKQIPMQMVNVEQNYDEDTKRKKQVSVDSFNDRSISGW